MFIGLNICYNSKNSNCTGALSFFEHLFTRFPEFSREIEAMILVTPKQAVEQKIERLEKNEQKSEQKSEHTCFLKLESWVIKYLKKVIRGKELITQILLHKFFQET